MKRAGRDDPFDVLTKGELTGWLSRRGNVFNHFMTWRVHPNGSWLGFYFKKVKFTPNDAPRADGIIEQTIPFDLSRTKPPARPRRKGKR